MSYSLKESISNFILQKVDLRRNTCKSLGKPLKLHKPHKKSLLYNAVVGENHLFSTALESATTRSNLYSCQPLKRKGITTEFVILLYVTRKERFGRIRDVLGL